MDPIAVILIISNLIIGAVSIGAVAIQRIWTGCYETLLLWMAFIGAAINLDHINTSTPGHTLLTVAVALLMLNRYSRIYFKRP